ncbi:MAG: transglutaminase family protein [Verrucomicrobiales bacterium]
MQRYKILHRTYYNFSGPVRLQPHQLRLRPREGPELRIESSLLEITPLASIRWHRDAEDNAVATASFNSQTSQLAIVSAVVIQQFNVAPLDFLLADEAMTYPFAYVPEDAILLSPYLDRSESGGVLLNRWLGEQWKPGQRIGTLALLQRLSATIQQTFLYTVREEPGVQSAERTLTLRSGSCRDFAALFMAAARGLGLATRFVSGYLNAEPSSAIVGATHAWAEVYLPGAGWKGFDPTTGALAGPHHIPVAVARLPASVPPVAGSFMGPPGATMDVGVWVTGLSAMPSVTA